MITEQQCIQELQKLNNYDYDLASSGIEPLELLARMRQCDGNSAEKLEISEKIKKIASEIPSDDLQSTAMCAYALSEAASLIADGYALNELSQLMADRIYFDDDEMTLYFGTIRVALGTSDYIDEKVTQMHYILPELSGKSGVLDMRDYQSAEDNVTFVQD